MGVTNTKRYRGELSSGTETGRAMRKAAGSFSTVFTSSVFEIGYVGLRQEDLFNHMWRLARGLAACNIAGG